MLLCRLTLVLLASDIVSTPLRADDAADREFFEQRIRPVLVRHCYECHATVSVAVKGGLLLDSRDNLLRGGESGPVIVPGKPDDSPLIQALRYESLEMPPKGKLPASVIDDFEEWVMRGAPDPRDAPPEPAQVAAEFWEGQYAERSGWWSYLPVVEPAVPEVHNTTWSDQPIDRFILAKLEEQGLAPAPEADRTRLIRRLTFALTGLPPRPDDIDAFLADDSDQAWPRLVDRLLDSPHFGEHWARHWMDVVRYTDTYGYEWDVPAKGAWRYRDYLTRAFNDDVPFDQLVREQIAGDLLPGPRINQAEQINESLIGVMFYMLGEKRHGDSAMFNGIHQEMLDNKIDAFSKAFLATTVSCARCHDHKLDPVSQREYFALGGMFMSSRWVTNTVDLPERNAATIAELKEIKSQIRPLVSARWHRDVALLADELVVAARSTDAPERPVTSSRVEAWRKLLRIRTETAPAIEDPLYVWARVDKAAREGKNIADAWSEVAQEYQIESQKRKAENAGHFSQAIDFRKRVLDGWSVDGVGLREISRCGDFTVSLEGETAVGRVLHGGLCTQTLSPRLNGAVRTPYLNHEPAGHVSFECAGGDFSACRTIIDNAFIAERQAYVATVDPAWVLQSTLSDQPEQHTYIEFATKASNPNFPPRVGLGGACSEEQAADPRSWFCLSRVVFHNAPFTPKDELTRFEGLLSDVAVTLRVPALSLPTNGTRIVPATTAETAARYAAWFAAAVNAFATSTATDDDVRLVNWLLDNGLLTNRRASGDEQELTTLVDRYRQSEQRLLLPWTVNGLADLDAGFDYRLNIRGDYDQLGDPVPRGCLRLVDEPVGSGVPAVGDPSRSGRLRLAELIASPHNPLTARVYVNRVWHWLFGTGIVSTPSDFGHLGGAPSHPELLDWLTARFIAEGWSTKKLIREIVLTETWRQSGQASARGLTVDPRNRLLHHYPLRRLEAEAIRDALLAASGRLDEQLYGPPINPFRVHEDPQKRLFSGALDGDGRRSLYLKATIMEPPKFLTLFNQPDPKIPTGHRDVTNTPAQSLALLNDPFVHAMAEHWATQLVQSPDDAVESRLATIFPFALGRRPTADELQRWSASVHDLAVLHQVDAASQMTSVRLWKDVVHALFNVKEFIYVR
jgi:hypothetical protein